MSLFTEFLDKYACFRCRIRETMFRNLTVAELCANCKKEYQLKITEDFKRVTRRGD